MTHRDIIKSQSVRTRLDVHEMLVAVQPEFRDAADVRLRVDGARLECVVDGDPGTARDLHGAATHPRPQRQLQVVAPAVVQGVVVVAY